MPNWAIDGTVLSGVLLAPSAIHKSGATSDPNEIEVKVASVIVDSLILIIHL